MTATSCRIVLDPQPNSGSWNMAVDETLLEAALAERVSIVRWYRWAQPTVSLGYFQDAESVAASPRFAGLPNVRRLSGGGAILHHLELTYSLAVPPGHPLARDHERLYEYVHGAIVEVLTRYGIEARLRGQRSEARGQTSDAGAKPAGRAPRDPFLCFGRADARDIVVAGHKIVGGAQRRRRGAILQHGSLLLRRSPHAPEFPGVLDLVEGTSFGIEAESELASAVASLLGETIEAARLAPRHQRRAAELERARYALLDWKRR